MIVKDEARVIERGLASVKPFIHYWVIVDTGSGDGTQDIIRRFMADIPGELHERPWQDFGHNRSEAMALARGKGDYVLVMDADNLFHAPPGWQWPALSAPAYYLDLVSSGTRYRQCLLVSNALPWRWVGVLHEYLTTDAPHHIEALAGPWVERRHEGARSRDPEVFRKDAAILEAALRKEPDNTRYAFYLAQSWRDAGELEKARQAYLTRAQMGGWVEETWYALYQVGVLTERLQGSAAEVRDAYLAAYQNRPTRAEPLVALARWHNHRREWAMGQLYARAAMSLKPPADILFMDEGMYRWGGTDEAAVSAYWLGDQLTSFALAMHLLDNDLLPENERLRVETNRDYAAPAVAAHTTKYPRAIVEQMVAARSARESAQVSDTSTTDTTLTIGGCKSPELFEQTMNSFLNCCQDRHRIQQFVWVDDSTSDEDRERILALYPFLELIPVGSDKQHITPSKKLLLAEVATTRYRLHIQDNWEFLVAADYIGRAANILQIETDVVQVAFNRNHAQVLTDRTRSKNAILKKHPDTGKRYFLDEPSAPIRQDNFLHHHRVRLPDDSEYAQFVVTPSLIDMKKVNDLGLFDEERRSHEEVLDRGLITYGYKAAFFDMIVCQRNANPVTSFVATVPLQRQ